MWGRREFLESSSSEEDISEKNSAHISISTDISTNAIVKSIEKPLPVRLLTANARIMSIQRAKLLDRGRTSGRVQVSPFFRSYQIEKEYSLIPTPPKEPKYPKIAKPEELEEIKLADTQPVKMVTKAKEFLVEENIQGFDQNFIRKSKKEIIEVAPLPTHQRVKIQASDSLRARPRSQLSARRNSTEFKTVTTITVQRPG